MSAQQLLLLALQLNRLKQEMAADLANQQQRLILLVMLTGLARHQQAMRRFHQ